MLLLAAVCARTAFAQLNVTALPPRNLIVTGVKLSTTAYLDLEQGLPLEDTSIYSGSAEPALLCYSPLVPREEWFLMAQLKMVAWPDIW